MSCFPPTRAGAHRLCRLDFIFFLFSLSPPSPFLSSLSLFLSRSSRPSSDPNFWETFFLNSCLPEELGAGCALLSLGRGRGRGEEEKDCVGGESQPPTNGEEGTGETLRARANEQKGETEARARAQRPLSLRCSRADFNSWLPGVSWLPHGGRRGAEGRGQICAVTNSRQPPMRTFSSQIC